MYQARPSKLNPPYITKVLADVPVILQEQVLTGLPKGESIEGIFVIPPEIYSKGFLWELNLLQALVFTKAGVMQVFAPDHRNRQREAVWVAGNSVRLIKLKLVLLYGRLEIWGGSDGSPVKIQAEYNTVAHKAFSPYLKSFIETTWDSNVVDTSKISIPSFDEFAHTSLSFYNGINLEALQPGEKVLAFAFQPELGKQILKIFHKKIYPKTLAVLTDRQLILLQEDLKTKAHYEWLFTFIPRQRVMEVIRNTTEPVESVTLRLDSAECHLDVSLSFSTQFVNNWRSMLDLLSTSKP